MSNEMKEEIEKLKRRIDELERHPPFVFMPAPPQPVWFPPTPYQPTPYQPGFKAPFPYGPIVWS
jgi:hypothetical protein